MHATRTPTRTPLWIGAIAVLCLAGCGTEEQIAATRPQGIAINVAEVRTQAVEVVEQSVGRVATPRVPEVAAETAGQILSIRVDAGDRVAKGDILAVIDDEAQRLAVESAEATVTRLEVLLDNQQRTVERLEKLALDGSASQSMLDQAVADARALEAQIAEATAQRKEESLALEKTEVVSPIAGVVQAKQVSEGDYVTAGQGLFEIVDFERLRAYLPFPETLASRIRPGQRVTLTLPTRASVTVTAEISDIRPMVGVGNNAIEAIVAFENPGGWMPGASVVGDVVVARHENGVVVPETSVVQRPAGTVVYVVNGATAHERPVETGVRRAGWVEIRSGVEPGTLLATDGAGFLTDGAAVRIPDSAASS